MRTTRTIAMALTACVAVSACSSGRGPALPTPTPSSSATLTASTLSDAAADDFVASLNSVSAAIGEVCRRTAAGRSTGRDRGELLAPPQSLTVSTLTYTREVTFDSAAALPWNSDRSMTVVITPELRGKQVRFTTTYDGIEVADRRGPHPEGYAAASSWPVMFNQVVTKTDYPYSCSGSRGTRDSVHTVGVWDGLRLAAYPDANSAPIVIEDMDLR